MRRILLFIVATAIGLNLVFGQNSLPVFGQYSEYFLNAGDCDEAIIKDSLAFIASDAGLLILDIDDIDDPRVLSCFYTDSYVHRIFIRDNIVFFTSRENYYTTVFIIDVSEPGKPELINSFQTDATNTNESILVEDNIMYLGMDYKGLYIYDITNLYDPVLLTNLPDISPMDMIKADSLIYMASNYRYLGILNVSDASNPSLLSWTYVNTSILTGIEKIGSYTYLSGGQLFVYDISDPALPEHIGEFGEGPLKHIAVEDSIVYTISADSLYRISVSDPEMPVTLNTNALQANYIYVNAGLMAVSISYPNVNYHGIGFYDVQDTSSFELISEHYADFAKEVFIQDDYAYVANGISGLFIIDVKNPSHPVLSSSLLEGLHVMDILIRDTIAFVRTHQGLHIINVADPYQPIVISNYVLTHTYIDGYYYSIGVYNEYVYIGGSGFTEIQVFDVSDIKNPVLVGDISVADWSPGISVFDDHLYVAGYWGGLEIFDIENNPLNPDRLSHYPLAFAFKVCPAEDKVFVVGAVDEITQGTLMFAIPELSNPVYTGNHPYGSRDLFYSDSYLFTPHRDHVDLNSSIHIVNVQNIYNFYLEQEIPNVAANAVWYKDDIVYAVEDFKFKIFGDSLYVSVDEMNFYNPEPDIMIYPNPVDDVVTIKSYGGVIDKIQLMDISGKMILEKLSTSNQVSLNVSRLNPGIYITRIFNQNNIYCRKVVVY